MRTWNLSTLDELETKVVMKFQETPKQRQTGRQSSKPKFGLSLAVVLATAVSGFVSVHCPRVSAESVSLESVATLVAQSIPKISPPFAELFENRFSDGWSPEQEELGLGTMVRSFSSEQPKYDDAELLDVALANQQESLSTNVPRLSSEEALRIIKKRRKV